MTKSLTEKWKDGELPHGFYYLKSKSGFVFTDHTKVKVLKDGIQKKFCYKGDIESVLAPVPSYEKHKQIQEQLSSITLQLKEANEIIRYYDIKEPKYVVDGVIMGKDPAHIYCVKWGVK